MLGLGLATSKGGFVDALAEVTNTKSILFDGGDEYVNFGNQSPIQDIWASGGSVSCWIKPNTVSDNERILDKKPVGFNGWFISLDNVSGSQCKLFFRSYWSGNDYQKRTTNTVINLGLWNHIVITYNSDTFSNTATMYVNGVSVALTSVQQPTSGNSVATDSSGDLTAGCQLNNGSPINMFDGNIDEIAMWNDTLTATEVAQIYNSNRGTLDLSTDTFDYSSSANLKAWWRMGDEASTRVVDDNANNLVIPDMRKTFFTGKSIDFDGTDDYVKVGSQSFTDDSDFSISLWFKSSDTTKQTPLLTSPVDSTGNWSLKMKTSGKVTFSFSDGSNSINSQDDGLTCSDGQWHHIVMTVDRSNGCAHRRYIDGGTATVRGSTAVTGDLNTGNFYYIGAINGSGNQDNFANAQICDVAIFNTVLDADTITSIYNSGEPNNLTLPASYTAGSGVDKTSNLQAYYRMGNGSIDAFSNSSQTGIGLIADYTNATLGTALVPNLSDDGNGNGSNWTLTALAEWTINTNTATAFEATTDSDIDGTADAKLYVKTSNSGLSADIPAGVYKITGTLSTTSTLPSTNCRFVWYGGYATNVHNLSAGNFEIYELCTSSSNNHHFQFQTSTEGHNFKLENVKFEPVNGNAGITINMSAFDVVDHAPNRNSGDMINFDATADIETDTPVQIYTVANTKSVLFDGSDDFIEIGQINSGISFTGTFSAWVKRSTTDTGDFIYDGRGDGNSGAGYFRFLADDGGSDDDKLDSQGTNTIYVDGVATDTCSAGVWHHVVVAGQTIHINEDLKIGSDKTGISVFDGNIDEVAIWNTTLSASEVAQIYHGSQANFDLSQNGGGYTSASNLQAWWRMETLHGSEWNPHASGSGFVINDSAGTETLGSNLVSDATWSNRSAENQAFETFTTSGNQIIQASNTTGHGTCSTSTFSLEVDAFYKISFNLGYTADDADNDTISVIAVGVGNTLGSVPRPFQITSHTTTGSQTYYFKVPSSRSDYRFGFQAGNNKVLTITLSDLSIQKVTGKNFGTMENMASSAIETDTP